MAPYNNWSTLAVPTYLTSLIGASGNPQVASITNWPSSYPFTVLLDYGNASFEAISVTSAPTGAGPYTLPCTRGFDGTTGQSHAVNATAIFGTTQQDFAQPAAHMAATANVHGVTGTLPSYLIPSVTVYTSAHTLVSGEYARVDASSGNVVQTLPTAPPDNTSIGVKQIAVAGGYGTTVTCGTGDALNKTGGSTSYTLTLANQGVIFQ